MLQAEYSTDEVDTDRVDRGFRVERVVRNLTDPKRTGATDAPFKLGDQFLVTYRMNYAKAAELRRARRFVAGWS